MSKTIQEVDVNSKMRFDKPERYNSFQGFLDTRKVLKPDSFGEERMMPETDIKHFVFRKARFIADL